MSHSREMATLTGSRLSYLNDACGMSAEGKSSGKKKKGSSYQTISATHRVGSSFLCAKFEFKNYAYMLLS